MKKGVAIFIAIALVGLGGFLIINSSGGDSSQSDTGSNTPVDSSSSSAVETNSVDISNFAFSPATITVKKGTTVTWTNQDTTGHTVTPDSGGFTGSSLLSKGQSFSVTFNEVGTFAYHCTPHPHMKGTVVVTE